MPPKKSETEGFYSPEGVDAAKVKGRPGPKPKNAAPPVDMRASAEGQRHATRAQSQTALPKFEAVAVDGEDPDLSADAGLIPGLSEREILAADIARIRATRKPFGAFTQKLAYAQRPGYYRHWFNDEPGRVDEAANNGWAHVKNKQDQPEKRVVGRGRDGGAMYGFLMELPKVFWEEDMQARFDAATARIDEIKKNPIRAKPGQAERSDAGKFYSPKDEMLTVSESVVRSRPA